jgi:hypothetical protein
MAEGQAIEDDVDEVEAEDVQGVNWEARFDERFRNQFKGEIDRKRTTEFVSAATGNMMTGLSRGMRGMGG